jgi:FkbM family methyltransferase
MKSFAQQLASIFGLRVLTKSQYESLLTQSRLLCKSVVPKLHPLFPRFGSEVLELATESQSQLGQEIIALAVNDFRPGYFVEFGCTDGISLSNTRLLESSHGWTGIVAEPAKCYHEQLEKNRHCTIDKRVVWSESKKFVNFVEAGELGTVSGFERHDYHGNLRKSGKRYKVETVSLLDLLDSNNAPRKIEFLSIDTEGSEFEILSGFDFTKYQFNFVCIEHNFNQNREPLLELMQKNGYVRVLPELSQFDDWYLHRSVNGASWLV